MRFRALRHGDLPRAAELEQQASAFPWTEGKIRDCLKAGYRCWVLSVEAEGAGAAEEIAAYAVVSTVLDEVSLQNIAVRPDRQGQGLGRQLLRFLLAQARDEQMEKVFLEVRASNLRAIALYESCGFSQVGLRRNYYPAPQGREDARVYCLELESSTFPR